MKTTELDIAANGLVLKGSLCTPEAASWPLVVMCHGLLSHRNSSKYRFLAQTLAARNIASLRFDFRGCGESEGELQESTVSARWHDLRCVIAAARRLRGFDGCLGLLGSSLGGFLVLLELSRSSSPYPAAAWATPSSLLELESRLESSPLPLGPGFIQDLRQYEILPALATVSRTLLIHGLDDTLVPARHARLLYEALAPPKCLHLLPGADHRISQPEWRQRAAALTVDWFANYFFAQKEYGKN